MKMWSAGLQSCYDRVFLKVRVIQPVTRRLTVTNDYRARGVSQLQFTSCHTVSRREVFRGLTKVYTTLFFTHAN